MRDSSLPHGYRLHALGSCIQMSSPLGFDATRSYLEARIGLARKSIAFLVPAVDLLGAARQAQRDVEISYARLRRAQKRVGAVHELTTWLTRPTPDALLRHPQGAEVVAAARASSQPMPTLDLARLQDALDWARYQTASVDWTQDQTEYRLAWVMLFLLGQVYVVLHGQPVVGTPWNFIVSPEEQASEGSSARCLLKGPVGLWRTSPHEGTAELVAAATDLLVLGFDRPAVRTLASMSAGLSQYDVEPVVADVLA